MIHLTVGFVSVEGCLAMGFQVGVSLLCVQFVFQINSI